MTRRARRKPLDPDLYAAVVEEAKARFAVWPSAYASGWVVKTYKARGGKYAGQDGELVGYEPCGRKRSDDPADYPKCRPLTEAMRMSSREVKDAVRRKRRAEAGAPARSSRARPPKRVATYRNPADGAFVANIIASKDYSDAGVRPLHHMLKAGGEQGEEAAKRMALDMAPFLPEDALLVPMPSRRGHGGAGLQLAEALSRLTGHPVVDVLRGRKRPSLYTLKKRGTDPSSVDLGLYLAGELPAGTPVIVDNVVGTGHTARSALRAIPGAIVLVHALDSRTYFAR